MISIPGTITGAKVLKSARQLANGDKISGFSKYEKNEPVTWRVEDVQTKQDPVLGTVIQVNVARRAPEGSFSWEHHEFFLRPSERIWILS